MLARPFDSLRVSLGLVVLASAAGIAGCGGSASTNKDSGIDTSGSGGGAGSGDGVGTASGGRVGTASGGAIGTGTGGMDNGGAGSGTPTGGTAGGGTPTGGTAGGGRGGNAGTPATGGSAGGGGGGGNAGGAGGRGGGAGGNGGAGVSCTTAATCPAPAAGTGTAACTNGICTMNCVTSYHRCGNSCVVNNSPNACGSSCTPCPTPAIGGTASCNGNPLTCGVNCASGYHECGSGANLTCVVNGSTNPMSCGNNCTVCPASANGAPTCTTNGMCVLTCNAGYHLCGTGANASCVADNSTNVSACGMSCTACPRPDHGNPTCTVPTGATVASCGVECEAGYHLCGTTCVQNNSVASGCLANGCQACTPPTGGGGGTMCSAGACMQTCNTAGTHLCGTTCVSNLADATCGTTSCTACQTGMTCTGTATNPMCTTTSCPANEHRCGSATSGMCVANTSVTQCGATCINCMTANMPATIPAGAVRACTNGACGWACDAANNFHLCVSTGNTCVGGRFCGGASGCGECQAGYKCTPTNTGCMPE